MDMIRGSLKNPVARFMFAIGIILLGLIAFSGLALGLFLVLKRNGDRAWGGVLG